MPSIDEQLQTNPYLDETIGDLRGGVPPAGQYTTGIDYQTLHAALTAQYVTEVIHKYEAQLGASPELYQAAQAAGYLTPEQVQALSSPGFTQTGTLEKKFASQGGLRTLAGPYTAERSQLLEQALADMQAASEKASSDAYTLATQTTGLRINALSAAGQLGLGKLNAGVSRQNSQDALSAAEASGDRPPLQLPTPPTPPTPSRPPWWEGVLAGLAPAAAAGAIRYLTQDQKTSPEDQARNQYRYEQERQQLTAQQNAPERPPGYGEVQPTQSPFGVMPAGYGRADTSAFDMPYSQVGAPAVNFNPYGGPDVSQTYAWQQPMQQPYQQPAYQMPSTPDYSYNQTPQYDYSGGGGGYDYGSGGYDYSGGYGGDPGYYDYNSYDSGSYYPSYQDYGSYGY